MVNADLDCRLIGALLDPVRYPHPVESVKLLETHISWVLLAGDYVYKIKKPVDFGFLDFSELSRRQFFCHEELRLNRRLAPDLYLAVIGIGGSIEQPVLDAEPAFEYAVKMRRFAEEGLLDHVLAHDRLNISHLESLAETMAQFHASLPPAAINAGYGGAEAVLNPARQNFRQLAKLLNGGYAQRLAGLEAANEKEYGHCLPLFKRRLQGGNIKECHGDLHLGNIVLIDDKPMPFDGIEFNPALRWIDVISDIAFLIMDLRHRRRPDLAFAFLNAYLQASGDYEGLAVLRFYLGYRAMVMAKVAAIRAAQIGKASELAACETYLALAEQFYTPPRPALIITYGLPGCGKSTASQIVLEKYQVIRIRSDVERKRLFGLKARQRSQSELDGGIYTPEATARTYHRLLELSRQILQSGFTVIVDAAFLKQQERRQFRELAAELAMPFVILTIRCDDAIQRRRIRQRAGTNDASEAGLDVYERLKAADEPLSGDERHVAVEVTNNGDIEQLTNDSGVWEKLQNLIV